MERNSPWIIGYKPLGNYQAMLYGVVAERWSTDRALDEVAVAAVDRLATAPIAAEYVGLMVEAPVPAEVKEGPSNPYQRREKGIKRDYLSLEARNRSLGAAGEEFVVAYERHRLHSVGATHLGDRVEQVSATKGDGLGYDVLSFDPDGRERLIEVKTTAFGREAPFYVTKQELALSKAEPEHFRLYRLFEFRRSPHMFELHGAISDRCRLDPISYLAQFG